MKKLREFMEFKIDKFLEGKDLRVLATEPWKEYGNDKTGEIIGTKYKTIILNDNTKYNSGEDKGINSGESLTIKVKGEPKPFKKLSRVELINAQASVYGEFSNLLSVKAEDINFYEK